MYYRGIGVCVGGGGGGIWLHKVKCDGREQCTKNLFFKVTFNTTPPEKIPSYNTPVLLSNYIYFTRWKDCYMYIK